MPTSVSASITRLYEINLFARGNRANTRLVPSPIITSGDANRRNRHAEPSHPVPPWLTASMPLSVGVISIDAVSQGGTGWLGSACLFRLFASPLVIIGLGTSRVFAQFPRAKRLLSYSLVIEVLTLVGMFALLGVFSHFHGAP